MKSYLIRAEVRDFDPKFVECIITRVIAEWHFRVQCVQTEPPHLELVGDGLMALDEDLFVDRIAQAVWEANTGACEVFLQLYDLQDVPFASARRDSDAYDKWRTAQGWQVGQLVDVRVADATFTCQLVRIVPDGVYVQAIHEPLPDWLLHRKLSPTRGEVALAKQPASVPVTFEVQHG